MERQRVNHLEETLRIIDATLLEEEVVLASLRVVGSGRTSEEVDAELYAWRQQYGTH